MKKNKRHVFLQKNILQTVIFIFCSDSAKKKSEKIQNIVSFKNFRSISIIIYISIIQCKKQKGILLLQLCKKVIKITAVIKSFLSNVDQVVFDRLL